MNNNLIEIEKSLNVCGEKTIKDIISEYRDIRIISRTVSIEMVERPKITKYFMILVQIPILTNINNGVFYRDEFCKDFHGYPKFKKLKDCISFIDNNIQLLNIEKSKNY